MRASQARQERGQSGPGARVRQIGLECVDDDCVKQGPRQGYGAYGGQEGKVVKGESNWKSGLNANEVSGRAAHSSQRAPRCAAADDDEVVKVRARSSQREGDYRLADRQGARRWRWEV